LNLSQWKSFPQTLFQKKSLSVLRSGGIEYSSIMIIVDILQYYHVLRWWWRDSEIAQLNFYRRRHVELYFWAVTCIFEPEFSPSRIAFAKITTVGAVLDDLYDTHGTLDELKTITEAVRRWIQIIETFWCWVRSFKIQNAHTDKTEKTTQTVYIFGN